MSVDLLPGSATSWERAVADGLSGVSASGVAIPAIRTAKLVSPPPSFLPYLIYEYGLEELTPFIPNLYDLINEGIDWQRVRGTPLAVETGLGWLGYTAALEEAASENNFWNSFQLRFTTLPENDTPLLDRLEGVTTLSVPKRSQFRRGVHYYDVPALIADRSFPDRTMLDAESGTRLRSDGPKWSFGRLHELEHTLTEAEGNALGNWVAPVVGGGLHWEDMTYPWSSGDHNWISDGVAARSIGLAAWFEGQVFYLALKDAEDAVIGYRRARSVWPVSIVVDGVFSFDGIAYASSASGGAVYFETLTGFGDGTGAQVESVALVAGGVLADGMPAGRLWLGPDDLLGGVEFAASALQIELRQTVREQIKIMLRF